jgi:hypothetical protein
VKDGIWDGTQAKPHCYVKVMKEASKQPVQNPEMEAKGLAGQTTDWNSP